MKLEKLEARVLCDNGICQKHRGLRRGREDTPKTCACTLQKLRQGALQAVLGGA